MTRYADKKYDRLYRQLKEKILTGELRQGEKLPSKRVAADRSGYSVITVERAYAMLEDEGYISARERRGYFVNPRELIPAHGETGGHAAPFTYAVDGDCRKTQDFEYSVWFKTVRKVISEYGQRLFVKAPGRGCAVLRNAIADYLLRYRGMRAEPERIVIGSGAEQLYETVVKLLGRDRVYGIEEPSYGQIRAAYEGMGASVCPLKLGQDGIESAELARKGFDVLHVTPFHSFPSGVTTSISKRREYLDWSEEIGGYIVEDDFDSEFFMPGHPIASLYAIDRRQSVIYVNTFSKSLSPAMRMGYMILPPSLAAAYEKNLGGYSCTVPVMDQYVLAEFISNGDFERHLNRMRRKMKKR